jgi:xyloglucan-specific endo-beta-1,4-glucanase
LSSTLYTGPNGNGQFVYSWLASTNITNFNRDISPLLHYLWRNLSVAETNYLGIVQYGTETFHSTSNVTFSAQDFNFTVEKGKPTPVPGSKSNARMLLPNLSLIFLVSLFGWLVSL